MSVWRVAVAILAAITVIATLAMFVAFGVAIWQPWGHRDEWKSTALLAMFFAVFSGFSAALVKDFGSKR